MSDPIAADLEVLLRQAFRPVDPPETLAARLETTLQELSDLAANYYRDRSRRPQTAIDDADTLVATHTTEGLVQDRDDLKRILECVQQLPDDRREALIMRFALGMDNREIASALDRSEGATKVLIHRAIKQLEQRLQEDEDD